MDKKNTNQPTLDITKLLAGLPAELHEQFLEKLGVFNATNLADVKISMAADTEHKVTVKKYAQGITFKTKKGDKKVNQITLVNEHGQELELNEFSEIGLKILIARMSKAVPREFNITAATMAAYMSLVPVTFSYTFTEQEYFDDEGEPKKFNKLNPVFTK